MSEQDEALRFTVIHDGSSMPILSDQFGRWYRIQQHRDGAWVHPLSDELTEQFHRQHAEIERVTAERDALRDAVPALLHCMTLAGWEKDPAAIAALSALAQIKEQP